MKIKRILAAALCAIIVFSAGACNGKDPVIPPPPDYSDSTKQMDFYCYTGPTDGTWTQDGEIKYSGEDFRTVERYKEYKEAGMTILLPQSSALFTGHSAWETSETKMVFDRAYEAGIDKIILTDGRLVSLCNNPGGIIGEGKPYADEAALDAELAAWIAPYKDHPAFYGVLLKDEPIHTYFPTIGQIYRSLKRIMPEIFVQCNLFPIREKDAMDLMMPTGDNISEQYRNYLLGFLEATGADYIMYDHYPFSANSGISPLYLQGLQVAAEVCRDKNVAFYNVTQTMAMSNAGTEVYRKITEDDAYYLTNLLLGFGVKQIAYFTYWTKQANSSSGETFVDGASFMTRIGEKTDIYYFMQKIHQQIQKFAPVIMNFTYNNSTSKLVTPSRYPNAHMMGMKDGELEKVTDIKIDKEMITVSELKDEAKGNYMYMVHNSINPVYKGSPAYITATLTFTSEYKYAVIYDKGESTTLALDADNSVTVKMHPGHAKFIMPY